MIISEKVAVSIHYTLTDSKGDTLDSSRNAEPLKYLHGAGNIIPGLEDALDGKSVGDAFEVTVEPENAYGIKQPELMQVVPKSMFNDMKVEVGMQFHAEVSQGPGVITVVAIEGDEVTIDGNHPLAGETLSFDVEVMDIRAATEDEIQHGHIHSGSCQH